MDGKKSKVHKRQYERCRKKMCKTKVRKEEWEIQCWASNANIHKSRKIQLFLGKNNLCDSKNPNGSSLV
jgi:hypothetical protein